jgi:hypothetical protein
MRCVGSWVSFCFSTSTQFVVFDASLLYTLSVIDPLEHQLKAEIPRFCAMARRSQGYSSTSTLLKQVDDAYGHVGGGHALRMFADATHGSDVVALFARTLPDWLNLPLGSGEIPAHV